MSKRRLLDRIDELVQVELSISEEISNVKRDRIEPKLLAERNKEIKERIADFHKQLKILKHSAEEENDEKIKEMALEKILLHSKEENNLINDLRKANVQCKLWQERKVVEDREELLGGKAEIIAKREAKTKEEIAKTGERLNQDLIRIRSRMKAEADRSGETLKELSRSSKVIEDTMDEHRAITGSIRSGRTALTKLQRREKTDRFLILLAFTFFLLVVVYIVKSRLRISFW